MKKWFIGNDTHTSESKYLDLDTGKTLNYIPRSISTSTFHSFNNSLENFLIEYPDTTLAFIGSRPSQDMKTIFADNICPDLNNWDMVSSFIKIINYELFLRTKYQNQYSTILLIFDNLNWNQLHSFLNDHSIIKDCFNKIINEGYKHNIYCMIKTDSSRTNILIEKDHSIYHRYFNLCNVTYSEKNYPFLDHINDVTYDYNFTKFEKINLIPSKLAFLDKAINYKTHLFEEIDIPIFQVTENSTHLQELAEIFNEIVIVSKK